MRLLVFISFTLAVAFMFGLDAVLWMENSLYGIGGIIGIIAFFIAYAISGDMIIAPRDFWRLSSWQVFKKKMGWAFGTFLIVALAASGALSVMFG